MNIRFLALTFLMLAGAANAGPQTASPPDVCRDFVFNAHSYTACDFDARQQSLSIFVLKPPTPNAFESPGLPHDVGFAMNAGMFHPDGTPVGLLVRNGVRVTPLNLSVDRHDPPGNFFWKPNGVFALTRDNELIVTVSEQFEAYASGRSVTWATQSGPMLVHEGQLHPGFQSSNSKKTRNGVGMLDQHKAVFVISNAEVSFSELGSVFLSLGCKEALYLDGTISSLWWPAAKRMDHGGKLATVIAVGRLGSVR